MKIFLLLAALLFSGSSFAGQNFWFSAVPDHFNLLYHSGESAKFYIRVNNAPTNPDYRLVITKEFLGNGAEEEVEVVNGVAVFATPPLAAGNPYFIFTGKLVGPASGGGQFEQIVQTENFSIDVKP